MTFSQSKWSLKDLYPNFESPELEKAYKALDEQVTAFEALRPNLKADMDVEDFMEMLEASEKSTRIAHKLYSFAGLAFSADTQDQVAQSAQSRVEQFLAEVQNRTLFFDLWWKDLGADVAERFMDVSGDYRYYLEEMRNYKPHTLSEAEEKVLNIKNVTGSSALITLYSAITNRYVYKLEVDGETKEMTRGELMTYVRGADADLRAAAYQELYRVYAEDGPILGQMYQTRVRDWGNENVKLRSFSSPISARNLGNDIPDEAVDTLLDVCQKNANIFQRYFKLKAKHLGVDKLRRYDVYAPVVKSDKKYDFGDAAEMVMDSFATFDPKLARLAQRVFDDEHLDSEVRKGKRGGAFCWSVMPEMSPWVMLNYQGRADDVATMAHELGHAIHSMLAGHHNVFTFHSSLPLAETASTFGEMMLVDQLLENETDESVRRDLLFRQVDDSYATIMRQAYFSLFERKAHQMVKENASVDELAAAYLENLATQFGDSMEISDEFKWEWVSIPHIYHTPFYVYAYAFGQLLVLSLYKQFKAEGEVFKPRYLKLLSAGGSQAPEKILTEAGIDIRSAAFWQGGFDVIKDLVEQLEALPIE
ncbi:MAG: M3 family oligoendopeptidase [Anaerolineae bacterium]|jgi:oligoendopeptidase F|nr:M3 family oligoendopeptidase [Anaerolineae bacterium]MBT4312030.1 M3 family oligoendopeptidase [Anaerolineae bacterium]MBT4459255.1 M3 family oligoendopeptidase [Anaerolineae bacterium]MBT4842007.1 M3 family oligoendopeptidase [Anaerolineae bacterium]MBT6061270.1 M3 family oligoendopeptidase [Anaerolineae bacterium]